MDNYDILINELKDIVKTYKDTKTGLFMNQLINNEDISNREKQFLYNNPETRSKNILIKK